MPEIAPLLPEDPPALGPYTLIGRLGRGGFGDVYLAENRASERVAVKLLRTNVAESGEERERFAREAAAAKQVARFCTAQVIDADFAGDRPYIVSEYVPGPPLRTLVAERGPLEGGALERLAIGIATALVAIHQAGIVHRDLKPPNVLLGPDGPRVIDFGIARIMDQTATVTGRALGTPAYMAPEQVLGREITPAADIFAWGATVVFAANGVPPFGRGSFAELSSRILNAPPDLGALTGPLRALVAACLEKDPARRPTASALLMRLLGHDAAPVGEGEHTAILAEGVTAAVLSPSPAGIAPVMADAGATPALTGLAGFESPAAATTRAPAGRAGRRWAVALAVLAGAAVVAAGAMAGVSAFGTPASHDGHGTRPPSRPSTSTATPGKPDTGGNGDNGVAASVVDKSGNNGQDTHQASQPEFSVESSGCDLGTAGTTCTATLSAHGAAYDWTGSTEHPLQLSSTSGHLDAGGSYTVTITLYPDIPRKAGSGTVTFTAGGSSHNVQVTWEAEAPPEPSPDPLSS
jgi:predicted Ser/Thr protein kinase